MVKLEKSDKESLVDYIISDVINYEATVLYFDSLRIWLLPWTQTQKQKLKKTGVSKQMSHTGGWHRSSAKWLFREHQGSHHAGRQTKR